MKPPRPQPRPASPGAGGKPRAATLPLGTRTPASTVPQDPANSPSAQARAKEMVGRVISDRYRVDELVAMGGMGAVYRGEHLLMRKQVAIKVLHPEIEDFPELVARFEREAVAGAHIIHSNVASASDFGKFDGESYFLVLEYIRGVTLSDVMRRGPVLPARAARIARQLATALGAAHAKGVVHRDVKPRNVMLVEGGDDLVKLIDFGLARVPVSKISSVAQEEDRRSLTGAGVVFGTVAYMAPETALGMSAVEPRSDLYALGIILYELLAGKHPFDATDPAKLFAQQRYDPPPPLRIRNPSVVVPDALEAVVKKLLEKDPAARYKDAMAVAAALEAAMPASSSSSTPIPLLHADLPITVLGMRPDTDSPAPDPPPAASEIPHPPVRPYTPRLLGRPAKEPGDRSRIWMGVAAVAVVVAAFSLLARRGPEPSPAPVPAEVRPEESTAAFPPPPAPTPTQAATASAGIAISARGSDALVAMRAASDRGDKVGAARALLELARQDAKRFHDLDVQAAAGDVTERAFASGGPDADRLATTLSTELGSDGLDVLYEVMQDGGPGATRAIALLSQTEILAHATPPMRIAFELRRASCQHKPNLFPRAANSGDARALAVLTALQPPACDPISGACCFRRHGELDKAIAAIKKRTGL